MKKLFILLLFCVGCKVVSIEEPHPKYFNEHFYVENLYYASIWDIRYTDVTIEFFKSEYKTKDVIEKTISNKTYLIKKDTVILSYEKYDYSLEDFKNIMYQKQTLQREDSVFLFTSMMKCRWKLYDEIYDYLNTFK